MYFQFFNNLKKIYIALKFLQTVELLYLNFKELSAIIIELRN